MIWKGLLRKWCVYSTAPSKELNIPTSSDYKEFNLFIEDEEDDMKGEEDERGAEEE